MAQDRDNRGKWGGKTWTRVSQETVKSLKRRIEYVAAAEIENGLATMPKIGKTVKFD
tara:strand:- start:56 stop:226 length:171 start_codon:yes stop_codon:yes gene_type:complete